MKRARVLSQRPTSELPPQEGADFGWRIGAVNQQGTPIGSRVGWPFAGLAFMAQFLHAYRSVIIGGTGWSTFPPISFPGFVCPILSPALAMRPCQGWRDELDSVGCVRMGCRDHRSVSTRALNGFCRRALHGQRREISKNRSSICRNHLHRPQRQQ
jgi:hypothetical protein